MFAPDRYDAAVVPGACHIGRWRVGDRGKRQQAAFRPFPRRPQAGDQQIARWLRAEFQHHVLGFLAWRQHALFQGMPRNVLVERLHHHHAMLVAERGFPVRLQAVAARVVGAGIQHVVARGLVRQPALVAHRLDHALALLGHDHRRIDAGENAAVARHQAGTLQIGQARLRTFNPVASHAQFITRLLRGTCGQVFFGRLQPGALQAHLFIQRLHLLGMPLLYPRHDLLALRGARAGKAIVHRLGGFRALLAGVVGI
ncbi:hypothetical protein D3C71_1264300 [compost metagenome]